MKDFVLRLLAERPQRYTDIMNKTGRPDKTVYVTLKSLSVEGLIKKYPGGEYAITHLGRERLELEGAKRKLEDQLFRPVVSFINMMARLQNDYPQDFEKLMGNLTRDSRLQRSS